MIITYPSGETGFVEYKRAFSVWGTFVSTDIPKDAVLTVTFTDENGGTVRRVTATSMYGDCDVYFPTLTAYPEERDPGRVKLKKFGFPESPGNVNDAGGGTLKKAAFSCVKK